MIINGRRAWRWRIPLTALLLLGGMMPQAAPAAEPAAAAESFVYKAKEGVTFVVTADGLASIKVGDREVAKGGCFLRHDLGQLFPSAASQVKVGPVGGKSMRQIAADEVEVRHVQGEATVTYRYKFSGEDVRISAKVENANLENDLEVVGFQGPRFEFREEPKGYLFSHDRSYINHPPHGGLVAFCHPSYRINFGGAWRADSTFGYGLSPLNTGLSRTMFLGDNYNWQLVKDGDVWRQGFLYIVPTAVPRNGARGYALNLRVSANPDRWHLLTPYKRHFLSTFGECRYHADQRPFAQFGGGDFYHSTPDNPYGFNGPGRRVDLPQGAKEFCEMLIPAMKAADVQGFIAWAMQGCEARGAMYRTDFHIFPPAIAANLPYIRERFDAAGLRMGLCTRPGEFTIRYDQKQDTTIRLNADDPYHLELLWRQYQQAIEMGFTAFYLDTFGNTVEDVKIMRYLRERMGPDIQTFTEFQCDVMMLYSGAYKEIGYDRKANCYHVDEENWAYYRWLNPGVQCTVVSRVNEDELPKDAERPYAYLFRHYMTPMAYDYLTGVQGRELKPLMAKYLDENWQWQKRAEPEPARGK